MISPPLNQLAPLDHPVADAFLLGFVAACSLAAALFFLRFWRTTRDLLFLAFSAFFAIQAVAYSVLISSAHPNEGGAWFSILRLAALAGVLAAILRKNLER